MVAPGHVVSDRDRRLDELLDRALDLDDRERAAFLAECGDLRADVGEMLRLHEQMDQGFLETPASDRLRPGAFEPGDVVGRYTIRGMLGAGGSGTVYEADQKRPQRTVALKVMSAGLASERGLQRFLEEAEILAQLEHPGIAHVYEAGVHEGVPYIAMELVKGARGIDEHEGSPRERLALFTQICDAVHFGHLKGVLHRDLKPGNILSRDGRAKVIDFGIARMEDAAVGDIAGTPRYMSPEQRDPGGQLDARSDVYSLGVVLAELLDDHAPDADLAAVVAKARAEAPADRYASASALADDLRRHRRSQPVAARAASWPHHVRLFARRRRGFTLALVGLFLALAGGIAVSIHFAVQAGHAQRRAEQQAYLGTLAAAASALRLDDVGEARQQLDRAPEYLRGWEWHYLYRRTHASSLVRADPGSGVAATSVAAGRTARVGSGEVVLHVRELRTGKTVLELPRPEHSLMTACSLTPDGRYVATGDVVGLITVYDLSTHRVRWQQQPNRSRVWTIAVTVDGSCVATAAIDGAVRIWSIEGVLLRTLRHEGAAYSVVFSSDGKRLFTGGRGDRTIRLWELASGREIWQAEGHEDNIESLALSPDGRTLVSGSMDRTVRMWDAATGRPIRTLRAHKKAVKSVAYGPDGKTLASGSIDTTVRLWTPQGRELACLLGHADHVRSVAYVRGGAELVTFTRTGEMRIWNVRDPPVPPELPGVLNDVFRLRFVGNELVAASREGAWVRYDFAKRAEIARASADGSVRTMIDATGRIHAVDREGRVTGRGRVKGHIEAMAWQGDDLLLGNRSGNIHVLGRGPSRSWRAHSAAVTTLAAHGSLVVSARHDTRVKLWRNGELVRVLATGNGPRTLLFQQDGQRVYVGQLDGTIEVVDTATGAVLYRLRGHSAAVTALALSPDGTRLASASYDGTVRVWHPKWRTQLLVLYGHAIYARSVAWSKDGKTLASGGGSDLPHACTIRLWESGGPGAR